MAQLLKYTKEMQKVHQKIKNSLLNKESFQPKAELILEAEGFSFFLYIPVCVAGWTPPHDSYRAVREGDQVIQNALPEGYKLVAWYGWGGNGWLAQTKKTS